MKLELKICSVEIYVDATVRASWSARLLGWLVFIALGLAAVNYIASPKEENALLRHPSHGTLP